MIIGISGKISSGKDTVGKIIQYLTTSQNSNSFTLDDYLYNSSSYLFAGNSWKIKKFADKLKDATCLILGCSRHQLEDQYFKNSSLGEEWRLPNSEEILTPRKILQLLGTECGREIIHPNIWVNSTLIEYKSILDSSDGVTRNNYPNWIITDVRFPNEAEAIKEKDGLLIRINRPCEECGVLEGHKMIPHNNSPSTHPSETSLDDYPNFHYNINNNGSIEELVEKVKIILKQSKLI
jgi:hypothetical protein